MASTRVYNGGQSQFYLFSQFLLEDYWHKVIDPYFYAEFLVNVHSFGTAT